MLSATSTATSGHVEMQFPPGIKGDQSRIQAFTYRNGLLTPLLVELGTDGYYASVVDGENGSHLVHIEIHKPGYNRFVLKHLFDSDDVTVTIPEAT